MNTIEANIKLHTAAVKNYKEVEPHYRKENIENVRKYIKMIKKKTKGEKLLDIGCGMGFIIDIAKEYFSFIRGIDVTPAMLEKVDLTSKNKCDIKVILAKAENIPFKNSTFDAVTAYAVLHHLKDLYKVFSEIYRVLKKGGMFYSGLDPNYYFWEAFSKLDKKNKYSDIVSRELKAVTDKDLELAKELKLSKKIIDKAEYHKHIRKGFKAEEIEAMIKKIGFSECKIELVWFIGQGKYIHDKKYSKCVKKIENYLNEVLPLSRHFFKYINIFAVK